MTDVDIKIENIVASASIGKDIVLTEVAKALEGVDFNREQFPGLVFKLQDPKTAALIFSSGKLVCTGAKSIDDSKLAIKKTVDLMRTIDTEIPHEFDIKIQNIVASANLQSTLNLEAILAIVVVLPKPVGPIKKITFGFFSPGTILVGVPSLRTIFW